MNKNIKTKIWLIIGIVFIAYYFIEALFVGFFFSLLWIWLAIGLACVALSVLTFKYGRIPLPKWLFAAICVILAILFAFFMVLEEFVISAMGEKGVGGLDYIIVLGAKVNKNNVPSKPLYWRIDAAEKYLDDNPNTIAILSGGKGDDEPISEAQCMYNELSRRGIDETRLILEDKSTNTNENMRFSFSHIEEDASVGIVTNNFHVFRAVRIAENISGKEIHGIASEYKDALLIHYMAREAAGIIKDTLEGNMNF